jgi:hypothetical protein
MNLITLPQWIVFVAVCIICKWAYDEGFKFITTRKKIKLVDGYIPNHASTEIEAPVHRGTMEQELAAAWLRERALDSPSIHSSLDDQRRQWDAMQFERYTGHTVTTRHATGSFRTMRRYVQNLRAAFLSPEELKYGNVQFRMVPTDSIKPDVDLLYPTEG